MATIVSQIPASHTIGDLGHTTDHDAIQTPTGILAQLAWRGSGWINAVEKYGADNGGTTDASNAIQNALNAAGTASPSTGGVFLNSGKYLISKPLVIPPGVALVGQFANEVAEVLSGGGSYGTILLGSSGFAQGSAAGNAMLLCLSQTDGGYSSTSQEHKIYGLTMDLGNIPGGAGAVDGIQILGGCKRIHLERIAIAHAPGNGVNVATGADGAQCNASLWERVVVRYAALAGFRVYRSSDGNYRQCMAENCTGNGWDITNLSNGVLYACRSEHNNIGFNYNNLEQTTGSGGGRFIGCSTDRNQSHGYMFSTTNGTGVPMLMSGCVARRDGRNNDAGGGNIAGINIDNYPSAVVVGNCVVFPGVNDDGTGTNSPNYGIRMVNNYKYVVVSGGWVHAAGQAIQDDSSGTVIHTSSTGRATGTVDSPVYGTPY